VITNPRPFSATEILVLCILAIAAGLAYILARRRETDLATAVAFALLATVVVSLPFTVSVIVKDIREASSYSQFQAARVGPEDNGLDTTMVDRIARIVPRHATYVVVSDPAIESNLSGVIRIWTLVHLLPRVAVRDPKDAQWVISFGKRPAALGIEAGNVRAVAATRASRLVAWVGVRTP
jgi:hypothetical protein